MRDRAGAVLVVDLDALAANYRLLKSKVAPAACAGVVKADAYGLGVARAAPALWDAGCRFFFVAHLAEGVELRGILPPKAEIAVLNGLLAGTEDDFLAHRLLPVLNSLAQVEAWTALGKGRGEALGGLLHVDTGMSRLGLDQGEFEALAGEPGQIAGIELRYLMTHLACADEPGHELNRRQLEEFREVRRRLGNPPTCFAN